MPLPFSKSQIEKLGFRLIAEEPPAIADLNMLHDLLAHYDAVLEVAVMAVEDKLGLQATSRVKNTGTILEKLHRHGGSWLKSMQDIAGLRIVGDWKRSEQDVRVAQIVQLFSTRNARLPRVHDRRLSPVNGYRAVHVVAYIDNTPVEIQVRTTWQHEWADLYEKLADILGRGIRYGEDPYGLTEEAEVVRRQVAGHPREKELRATIDQIVELIIGARKGIVRKAILVADLLDLLEQAVEQGVSETIMQDQWRDVEKFMAELRETIGDLAEEGSALVRLLP